MTDTGATRAAWFRRLLPDPGPARLLALATLIDTLGKGLFLSVSVIFLTRSVGLTVREVGIALAVAAAVGLLTGTPLGYLADRHGPREVLVAMLVGQGAASGALVLVHSFWGYLVVACAAMVCGRGAGAARGALMAGLFPPARRVRMRAYLRAITNVGISAGTVFAGIALGLDTRAGYVALIAGDAASFVIVAGVLLTLPHLRPVPVSAQRTGPRLIALRDRPFLACTALNGVLALHYGLFTVAMPLWVTQHTNAPRWLVAPLFLVNGVTAVLLQVRVSRGAEEVATAARASARAGVLLGGACLLYALSAGRAPWLSVTVLVAAAFVHVLGELLQAAGSFGLAFGLAPDHAQGQYQGAFDMGYGVASMTGPVVVTTLAIEWGTPGWLLLGAAFVVAGALMPPVARWAARSRPVPIEALGVAA